MAKPKACLTMATVLTNSMITLPLDTGDSHCWWFDDGFVWGIGRGNWSYWFWERRGAGWGGRQWLQAIAFSTGCSPRITFISAYCYNSLVIWCKLKTINCNSRRPSARLHRWKPRCNWKLPRTTSSIPYHLQDVIVAMNFIQVLTNLRGKLLWLCAPNDQVGRRGKHHLDNFEVLYCYLIHRSEFPI